MGTAYGILGIVVLVVAAIFTLGWIVPLVMGIVRQRRANNGLALIIIGGAWGLAGLAIIGISLFGYYTYNSALRMTEKPANVEAFNPAQYKGQLSKIELPYKGDASLVVSPIQGKKRLKLIAKDGMTSAPVGIHGLENFEMVANDAQGAKWTASCSFWSSRLKEVNVKAGSTANLDLGEPLTAYVSARHYGSDNASFDLEITGSGGQSYSLKKNGKESGVAGFEVLDQTGNVVWQGKFEAG